MTRPEKALASNPPRVTVIIIFLNAERYLQEAIDSVLQQTVMDWELILVDDGSTDASRDIAHKAKCGRPGQVRYYTHPDRRNLGMSASRNLGVREARGEYIAFLDSDDVYLPERLARHIAVLDALPQVSMVQSDHIQWYSWAGEAGQTDDDFVRPAVCLGDRVLFPPLGLVTILAVPWLRAVPASMTVRRDAFLAVGGFDESFRDIYEDQVFTTKLYLEHTVYVLQGWLVKYRRHPESWTRYLKESGQFVDGMPHPTTDAFRAWLGSYVRSRGVRHPLLDELVDRLSAPPAAGVAGRARVLVAPLVGRSKMAILRWLPTRVQRSLLRLDRRRYHARLRKHYAGLCDRMIRTELTRNGFGEVADK